MYLCPVNPRDHQDQYNDSVLGGELYEVSLLLFMASWGWGDTTMGLNWGKGKREGERKLF